MEPVIYMRIIIRFAEISVAIQVFSMFLFDLCLSIERKMPCGTKAHLMIAFLYKHEYIMQNICENSFLMTIIKQVYDNVETNEKITFKIGSFQKGMQIYGQ